MLRLLLLRHAKTERAEPGERDRDRKLMPRGESDAQLIGTYMVQHALLPDLVVLSPATRTVQTWSRIAAALSGVPRVTQDERIYNASAETLADVIREGGGDAPTLLLIGHNPGMHDLAVELIGSGDVAAREDLKERLPTSGLIVIDFAFDDWAALQDQAGRLVRYVSPRLIESATD
jgi:phosphohistidine phosphatase